MLTPLLLELVGINTVINHPQFSFPTTDAGHIEGAEIALFFKVQVSPVRLCFHKLKMLLRKSYESPNNNCKHCSTDYGIKPKWNCER